MKKRMRVIIELCIPNVIISDQCIPATVNFLGRCGRLVRAHPTVIAHAIARQGFANQLHRYYLYSELIRGILHNLQYLQNLHCRCPAFRFGLPCNIAKSLNDKGYSRKTFTLKICASKVWILNCTIVQCK